MTTDLLTAPADAADETPEWEGPDPRDWYSVIPGLQEKVRDLETLSVVLNVMVGADPMVAGTQYNAGLTFVRKMQDQLRGEVAESILTAFQQHAS